MSPLDTFHLPLPLPRNRILLRVGSKTQSYHLQRSATLKSKRWDQITFSELFALSEWMRWSPLFRAFLERNSTVSVLLPSATSWGINIYLKIKKYSKWQTFNSWDICAKSDINSEPQSEQCDNSVQDISHSGKRRHYQSGQKHFWALQLRNLDNGKRQHFLNRQLISLIRDLPEPVHFTQGLEIPWPNCSMQANTLPPTSTPWSSTPPTVWNISLPTMRKGVGVSKFEVRRLENHSFSRVVSTANCYWYATCAGGQPFSASFSSTPRKRDPSTAQPVGRSIITDHCFRFSQRMMHEGENQTFSHVLAAFLIFSSREF